jgi:hypothetical protein
MFQPPVLLNPFLERLIQERFCPSSKEDVRKLGNCNCSQEFLMPVLPPDYTPMSPYLFFYNFSHCSYLKPNQQPTAPSPATLFDIHPLPNEPPSGSAELGMELLKESKMTGVKSKPIYRRNILKSILRNMRKYAKKNQKSITEKLQRKGYTEKGIEQAFFIINNYRTVEDQRGSKYRKQLDTVAAEKSILTFILKDSLKFKIDKFEAGNHGRITLSNYKPYKKAYMDFYSKVNETLEGSGMEFN